MIGLKLDRYDSGGASHPTCPPKPWRRRKLRNLGSIVAVGSEGWWRRGESNPRPKTLYSGLLRAFPVVSFSSPGTPAGRVPFGPSRFGFRPSSPREGDWGYPVRATPFRLHGQSAVGRTRLIRPRKRSYSRWRLWVPAFNEVRGASARNPGASTSPSKPFRPRRFKIPCFPGQREPVSFPESLDVHVETDLVEPAVHFGQVVPERLFRLLLRNPFIPDRPVQRTGKLEDRVLDLPLVPRQVDL